MAKLVTLPIRILDLPEFKLLLWELRQLETDMRTSADQFAPRLTDALDRFCAPLDRPVSDEAEDDGVT